MGKQPTTGQKKSKDTIAKAASQKKGGHKKWTKGKAKQKAENAVFVDQATYDRLVQGIPKLGKHISISSVVQKYKVNGSIARVVLRRLAANGALKQSQSHSKQVLYTPAVVAVQKPVTQVKDAKKDKAPAKKK